jgi:hypothetical protein
MSVSLQVKETPREWSAINMSNYTPLLKVMRGRPAMVEVGDETRQGVDVVKGFIWDVYYDNTILLMIIFSDENIEKPREVIDAEAAHYKQQLAQQAARIAANPGQPVPQIAPPLPVVPHREWHFKWILVENVIAVQTDGHVRINMGSRQLSKPKLDPLYNDGITHWEILNNNISKAIVSKLKEIGLEGEFPGVYRNAQNEIVPLEKAAFSVVVPASSVQIPITPQAMAAAHTQQPSPPSPNVVSINAPVAPVAAPGVPAGV